MVLPAVGPSEPDLDAARPVVAEIPGVMDRLAVDPDLSAVGPERPAMQPDERFAELPGGSGAAGQVAVAVVDPLGSADAVLAERWDAALAAHLAEHPRLALLLPDVVAPVRMAALARLPV